MFRFLRRLFFKENELKNNIKDYDLSEIVLGARIYNGILYKDEIYLCLEDLGNKRSKSVFVDGKIIDSNYIINVNNQINYLLYKINNTVSLLEMDKSAVCLGEVYWFDEDEYGKFYEEVFMDHVLNEWCRKFEAQRVVVTFFDSKEVLLKNDVVYD